MLDSSLEKVIRENLELCGPHPYPYVTELLEEIDRLRNGCGADKNILHAIREFERASAIYPPFASAHEGYAILLEEVEELWEEVKKSPKKREPAKMREEAIQVAAMALRFLKDVCS